MLVCSQCDARHIKSLTDSSPLVEQLDIVTAASSIFRRGDDLVPPPRIHRHGYFGVVTQAAAHGKFLRRPRMTGSWPVAVAANRSVKDKRNAMAF